MTASVDSDVLIDYLNGVLAAGEELSRYDRLLVSRVSWMEVLVGARTETLREARKKFLRRFEIVELDENIAREAVALRQEHRLKLPDAVVWASARINRTLLITRNAGDFPPRDPGIRIPYRL